MKILVIGESCLDVFHYGSCRRLAPAAPVPVFNLIDTKKTGGMAMNVYNNLKILEKNVEIYTNKNWQNIRKTRYVEKHSNHMFLRVDENDTEFRKANLKEMDFSLYDAIVVSDYDKGFLTKQDMKTISSKHPKTFLDTKKELGDWCKDFTFIKINGYEYDKTKHLLDKEIRKKLIITQGSKGCLFRNKSYSVPMVEVKDVSGAGDTFLASFVYKFINTDQIEPSIQFANQCATKVVQKRGVSTI